jgi:Tfp pilus assembly protein PilF
MDWVARRCDDARMIRFAVSRGSALALALVGCGGASQPAQSPGTDVHAQAEVGSGAGATGGGSAAPGGKTPAAPGSDAAPASAEVDAGNKAFDAGDFEKARASFDAATKKNPKNFGAFFNLGQTCEKLGDKACAEAAYKSAIAIKPDFDTAAAELSALYLNSARIDDALAVAKQGLAAHPGSGPLHAALGGGLAEQHQQELATKEFMQAIQITPSDPMFHLGFAHYLHLWGDNKDAAFQLDTALPLVKDDYALLDSIGHEYRLAAQVDSCIKVFDRLVKMKDGGEVRTERGLCKLAQKDEKGGFEDLQAAVTTEPSYATAHYYLAGRLAANKKLKEAAAEYSKYLQLAPDGSLAGKAKERLDMIEKMQKK